MQSDELPLGIVLERRCSVDKNVAAADRLVGAKVIVLLAHPALPVRTSVFAVAPQATSQAHGSRRVNPGGEGQRRRGGLACARNPLDDDGWAGLNLSPFREGPAMPVVASVVS